MKRTVAFHSFFVDHILIPVHARIYGGGESSVANQITLRPLIAILG